MCTRILWSTAGAPGEGHVLVGRSMDWYADTATDLWALPAGIEHTEGGENTLSWRSTYGSLVASMYGAFTVDGLNTAGLVANGLYLSEADYGVRDASRPGIGLPVVVQYLLDNFATVAEVVAFFETTDVQIIPVLISGKPGTAHVSVSDRAGDSAVIEFLGGRTSIHHSPEWTVMTNSPPFDEQLELLTAYRGFGGDLPLPGATDSPARYVRARHFSRLMPEGQDVRASVASMLAVVRNVSVPFGENDPDHPNIAPTRWRVVASPSENLYFFDSTSAPNLFWVDLAALDLSEDAPVLHLDLQNGLDRVGDVTADLRPGDTLHWLDPTAA
jgi:penicillin V acylase-like amidase (Ntn superfamily)